MSAAPSRTGRAPQAGVVLFIALIVLVAMTLAGLAAMRSVGTGVALSANLSFKQGATKSAEAGLEAARTWLLAQSEAALATDQATAGYYSSYGSFEPASYDWAAASLSLGTDDTGNTLRYVIHRLCQTANAGINAPAQQCVLRTVASSGGQAGASAGGVGYGVVSLQTQVTPYFRITVRSEGPRDTVSYVQAILD